MRGILAGLLLVFVTTTALWAQPAEGSAEWSVTTVPVPEASALLFEVTFEVRLTPGWHIYDLGPYDIPSLATGFDLSSSVGIEPVGEPYEIDTPTHKFDPVFGFETGYFEPVGRFGLRVRATEPDARLVGEVEYQICRDEVGCIRGVWEFDGRVTDGELVIAEAPEAGNGSESGPGPVAAYTGGTSSGGDTNPGGDTNTGGWFWKMILLAVISGLGALGTPCVFPMIPMTVSFFMKDGEQPARARFKATMFGLFIVTIYTLPVALLILAVYFGGGESVTAGVFNWLATHWIPNVIFFAVFMIFAASLLGAFEIRMPGGLVNRSDRGAERGGLVGVFFLALTLVLVSFSCTLPIVGGALVSSTQGEFWRPIATMLVFSIVFALPFTFFAFFPRIMERLPRSGGWLNSVKVVLGLVEVALGLKFLSVADQTYHWGLLDREVYLAIWIVVFSVLGLYLLGKIRFRHDSPTDHIGVGRLGLAIAVFSFVVYLVPGMWGAPLKGISGYLPPMSSQDFISTGSPSVSESAPSTDKIKYSDILHLPHGMSGYFDLEQGLTAARAAGKPVFLDFTGHGCVNCREMEARVWVDGEVQRILAQDYVVIALYSDDRTRLPQTEWLTTSAGRELKTLGRKNSHIVGNRYGVSAQPAYLLLDGDGEPLAPTRGYDLDIESYIAWLRSGVEAYKKR
ncbi:MAG: thioredoxin family protein [Alistipes sp.]|nr:thioredoxin family protein [Alistipes sp.]